MSRLATFLGLPRLAAVALIALVALAAGQASATIISVTGTPTPLRVNVVSPQTLSVTWRVQISIGPAVTVTSSSGQIFIDGSPVATVNGTLARPVTPVSVTTVVFTETVPVSRALARRIGAGGVVDYRRTFAEVPGGVPVDGIIAVRPTISGPLAVSDLDLRFDDDSQYRFVDQGARLVARAEITSIGAGLLEGRWEHAGPGSISAGEPVFQILSRDQRSLGGSRRTVLRSPALPTALPGLHIVRFRPVRLDRTPLRERDNLLELHYVVRPADTTSRIELIAPAETTPLTAATQFVWQPVPDAAHHRLEFLAAGAGPVGTRPDLVAAVDLPGAQRSARLRPFTLRRLEAGSASIYWRITAFDRQGNPIAVSPLRRLRQVPPAQPEDR